MYNRYIPCPDGSYKKNRMQDRVPPPGNPATGGKNHSDRSIPPHNEMQKQPCDPNPRKPESVGSFLKKLLPGDFDTSDLIIILLLLLMSGDCAEDQNRALLTMALYLFL